MRCFQNELHHLIILNLKWYQLCKFPWLKVGRLFHIDE